jgi:hypothetical protein
MFSAAIIIQGGCHEPSKALENSRCSSSDLRGGGALENARILESVSTFHLPTPGYVLLPIGHR